MLFKTQDFSSQIRPQLRGGEGDSVFTHMLPGVELPNMRLFAQIKLEPGCSIGVHKHENEAEIYFGLSGEGTVDDNGETKEFHAGDAHVCLPGCEHAIKNTGSTPLIFLAAIIKS